MTDQQEFTPEQKLKRQLSRSSDNLIEVAKFIRDLGRGEIEPTEEIVDLLIHFTEIMQILAKDVPPIIKRIEKKLKKGNKNA